MQGASMAVGKFVHGKLQDMTARWAKLGEQHIQLLKRARMQEVLARRVEQSGSTESALQLLEEHARLLHDEHALLQDPTAVARLGLDATQVDVLRAGNDAALADTHSQSFEVMRLRFHGLAPIASNGLVWSGTRAQIEAALGKSGAAATQVRAEAGRWTAQIGGHEVTFVEIGASPSGNAHDPGAATAAAHDPGATTGTAHAPGTATATAHAPGAATATAHDPGAATAAAHDPGAATSAAHDATAAAHDVGTATGTSHQRIEGPKPRVTEPVKGLFEGVKIEPKISDWRVEDHIKVERDGTKVAFTDVTTPDGKTGMIERAYNPTTKQFEMRNAFLDNLPGWVNEGGPGLDPRGIPTVHYLTIRQMKLLGVDYGGYKKVKMSTIQNVRGVIEFNAQLAAGVDPNAAILKTHSVQYGETTIQQSGERVVGAKVNGGQTTPLQVMLEWYERHSSLDKPIDPAIVAKHDELIAKYGNGVITRASHVEWNYDIELDVEPFAGGVPPVQLP
jgi:hypothetical protein